MASIIKTPEGKQVIQFDDQAELLAFVDERVTRILAGFTKVDRKHLVLPGIDGADNPEISRKERAAAFLRVLLFPEKGFQQIRDESLRTHVEKALAEGADASGGYLVPPDVRDNVIRGLPAASELFPLITVLPTSRDVVNMPKLGSNITWSWAEPENTNFNVTEPTFGQIQFVIKRANALAVMSREILGDSAIDLTDFLTTIFTERAGEEFDRVIAVGDPAKKEPRGLTNSNVTQTVASITTLTADHIIQIYHKLPKRYRRNATWVMCNTQVERVRKLKDSGNQYLWIAGLQQDRPDLLMSKPIAEQEDLPTTVIYFGDMRYLWMFKRQDMGIETSTHGDYFKAHQMGIKFWFRLDSQMVLPDAFSNGTGITG